MARTGARQFALVLAGVLMLTGCEQASNMNPFKNRSGEDAETDQVSMAAAGTIVEQDVEAPEVFQASEAGLWDGRPSLGGVWVAHPDVSDPERVMIRNPENGQSVIGALFRRERENPGPRLQVSSDAAEELGMLAGSPTDLNVVALRREEVEVPSAVDPSLEAPAEIDEQNLDEPLAAAAAAIDEAEGITPAATPMPEPAITPAQQGSELSRPYIQLGIFSVEANANETAERLRSVGVTPEVLRQSSQGKTFWRVIAGPASSTTERDDILAKVKGLGFADAYAVAN